MNKLLERLKLTEYFITESKIRKNEFVNKLRENVEEGNVRFCADSFGVFSSSKNEYKGKVGFEGFKIKRRRKFFNMNIIFAIAKGKYTQKNNSLIIETEINGFHRSIIPVIIGLVLTYVFTTGIFLVSNSIDEKEYGFVVLFLLFHAAFMLSIPYLIIRRNMNSLKRDLEKELYFLTRKQGLKMEPKQIKATCLI